MKPANDNGADAFVAAAELALKGEPVLSDDELARVMTAAVKLYAARAEETGDYPPPVARESVNATEVATAVSEMIRAVDLNMFDLSMWFRRPKL